MKKTSGIILLVITFLVVQVTLAVHGQTDMNKQYKGIAIYIDYPDVPATITPERLDLLLNGMDHSEEGAERSFRKYWYEQSRRNVDFTHDIFFYTAPENSTYYESITWQEGILLWKDALEWIIDNYPDYDWRTLSICDDSFNKSRKGGIASVKVISSKWGPKGVGAAHGPGWTLSNGIKINSIEGATIRAPWDTAPVNIFMTLHESGHNIFGFPDTYDTDGGAEHSGGTGVYTLMSGGKPDVEPIGAPFLAEYNWGYIIEPEPGTTTITLRADGDSIVVFRNPYDPYEYFSIEARKKSNIGNSLFPVDLGLLIWHTDSKVSTSNRLSDRTPQKHYRNSIEQADGLFELERQGNHRGNAGDIFVPGKTFTNDTHTNSRWWNNDPSNFEIRKIEFVGDNFVKFNVVVPEPINRYDEIPQDKWKFVSATPSTYGHYPSNAFDGDENTYYHTNSASRSHNLVIDLGEMYKINEFHYQSNSNTSPPWEGRIADYNLFLSDDGVEWGNPVASDRFFYTGISQYVLLEETLGRYLKLEAINSWSSGGNSVNDNRTSIAEIKLRGSSKLSSDYTSIGDHKINLYPNPVNDILQIECSYQGEAELKVSNLNGSVLKLTTLVGPAIIDLSDLSSGLYFIQVKLPKAVITRKLIKL